MGLAEGIIISEQADADLHAIGGGTESWLIGELFLLPQQSEVSCPELDWDPEDPRRRRWDVGIYTAVFYLHVEDDGKRIAVIEWVLEAAEVTRYTDRLIAAAEEAPHVRPKL